MDPSTNIQFPAPDDEEEDGETSYRDAHFLKWSALLSSNAISTTSTHKKIHSDRMMQDCFSLSNYSTKLKPKRKPSEAVPEILHGGRIVRSTGRKDRHSKVCTAKGPKDRRVRLSPKTAIQFYDVQDRLGYDRPSKAIDWLMKEAQAAIDALDKPQTFTRIVSENNSRSDGTFQGSKEQAHLNEGNPVSGFSFNGNGAIPSCSGPFQAFSIEDFNSSMRSRSGTEEDSMINYRQGSLNQVPPNIIDENCGMQRIFTWNFGNAGSGPEYVPEFNSLPVHFTGPPFLAQNNVFLQREPLQSSFMISNNSPVSSIFPGISNFSSEEFLNFASVATVKEDGNDKNADSGKPSSAASSFAR